MELNGVCPWCGGDRLYYNTEKNVYVCFRISCRRSGRGKPPVDTWLGLRETKDRDTKGVSSTRVDLPADCQPLPQKPNSLVTRRIYRYLASHRIPWEAGRRTGLLHTPRSLVVVFYDHRGKLRYYQQRKMFGAKGFRNPASDKGGVLFLTRRNPRRLIMVESAFSAIRVAAISPRLSTGAFLGKPNQTQTRRIRRMAQRSVLRHVTLLLDADALGQAVALLGELRRAVQVKLVALPYGDPCNFDNLYLRKRLTL